MAESAKRHKQDTDTRHFVFAKTLQIAHDWMVTLGLNPHQTQCILNIQQLRGYKGRDITIHIHRTAQQHSNFREIMREARVKNFTIARGITSV